MGQGLGDLTIAKIYNNLEQLIISEPLHSLQTKINLSEHANGIYFVKVVENNNSVYLSKIIKQ